MSNYTNAMRRMRKYVADVRRNRNSRAVILKNLEQYKGSQFYDQELKKADDRIERERTRLAESAKKDLTAIVEDMRRNVSNRITKEPTPGISATLDILGKLENLSPTQATLYAQQMADYPLAMQRLQEIVGRHGMRITIPDPEQMLWAVEVLEHNMAMIIQGYHGNDDTVTPSVGLILPYLAGDEDYMNTKATCTATADKAFWAKIIGFGTPDMLDSESSAGKRVKVQHFFKDMDGMLAYLHKYTDGLEGPELSAAINQILEDCPDQYGAAYRNYQATGEKLPLNQEDN